MEEKRDAYNQSVGDLDDGYDCPVCLNRGYTCELEERGTGIYDVYRECDCMRARRNLRRLRRSGLEQAVRDMRFDNFLTNAEWQQHMKDTALHYAQHGVHAGNWFYIGGQPGCGKTHLCTAISGKLLEARTLIYMPWAQESKALKALVTDAEAYAERLDRFETVDVLYIDDFLKPVEGGSVSAGDLKLAFELLNYRYIARKPTILSSEWYARELLRLDEATASRIYQRCGKDTYCLEIGRDKARNFRMA